MAELFDRNKRILTAFLVGVQTPSMPPGEGAELLGELRELVENLGLAVAGRVLVRLRRATPAFLLGRGQVGALIAEAKAAGADVIVVDETLSPAQQRNWEEESGFAVIDRQEVILEVFADRAHTREAMLQVELARQEYFLPRLTRAWTHLSRQRGRGALGGEGETQLEQDRRAVRARIAHLRSDLAAVRQRRGVQRRRRLRVPVSTCAIVGYTNAGKSCLLNRLTGARVLVENRLFATLDPTTRQLALPNNQKVLVTDTVGFIRRLPHGLVEAFKATLEEVVFADFLIHVLDVTNPNVARHHVTTLGVLAELGADRKTILTVFNKIDIADPVTLESVHLRAPDAFYLSAKTGAGLDALREHCASLIAREFGATELLVPPDRYDVIARLYEVGHIHAQELRDDGIHLQGRFPAAQAAVFAPFVVRVPPAPSDARGD
ncbi:MAG TPA: GTPase HflX [Opitutaceae bacterium]|nr:GTPase HflX [Opitutaceae bacterium]